MWSVSFNLFLFLLNVYFFLFFRVDVVKRLTGY